VAFKLAQLTAPSRSGPEDRLAVHHLAGGLVVIVADGAGGISGGGVAADRVVAILERALGQPGIEPLASATWTQALAGADLQIDEDPRRGEATAVLVAISTAG
jgi:serine/threonine protein phosphatase PrpC